ncbi:anti-sigma factor family protein [Thalassoglobus polymorphus]|uniref:Putative zinc-finger domain-containing protein n=1 Tax=Thalassoglobus polymorphus TaxID=2527994 RepID=A0A517QNP0_9PLAN|nr:zf-HC2 domain-containing protein [Thalassoglobus polymorphus]QDT33260.1 hypothetical protein Mal48_25130 [Thalassoglobus polymorphus]
MQHDDQKQFDSSSTSSEPLHGADEGWGQCNSGEILGMLNTVRAKRRRKQLAEAAAVGGSLILLFAVTLWAIPSGLPPHQGRPGQRRSIACQEVFDRAEDFVAGNLSALIAGRLEEHLARCPRCKHHVEHLRANVESNQVVPPVLLNTSAEPCHLSQQTASDLPSTMTLVSR